MCKQEKKTTQEKVLEAAEKIFGEKGYHGSTTKEIAEEAGVAEGTIFRYFKTKKDLLVNILVPVISRTAEMLLHSGKERNIEEMINKIFLDRSRFVKRTFPVLKIILFEGEVDNSIRQKVVQELLNIVVKQLEQIFKNKIESGELRPVEPFIAARTMMSLLFGMCIMNEVSTGKFFEPVGIEDFIPQSVDIFLRGIENTGGGNHGK
jgi:AcrR family transcriptional regulator